MFECNDAWESDKKQDLLNEKLFQNKLLQNSNEISNARCMVSKDLKNVKKNKKKIDKSITFPDDDAMKEILNINSQSNENDNEIESKSKKQNKKKNSKKLKESSELHLCQVNVHKDENEILDKTFKRTRSSANEDFDKQSDDTMQKEFSKEISSDISENSSHEENLAKKKKYTDKEATVHQPYKNKSKTSKDFKHAKSLQKLTNRLEGSQFRWINEKLYTIQSNDAYKMFQTEPHLFDIYHKGFVSQVHNWPENPVDIIIKTIQQRDESLVIADFGCGDAKISRSVKNKVHSFDFVAANDAVIACDMRKVPLADETVDIVVFSLSLMGTNVSEFIIEANRVLKIGGTLKIAEVKSRIEDIGVFVQQIEKLGFKNLFLEVSNKMFVLLDFEKATAVNNFKIKINLKPCVYKKR